MYVRMPPRFGASAEALVAPNATTAATTDVKPSAERNATPANLPPGFLCVLMSSRVIVSSSCETQLMGCRCVLFVQGLPGRTRLKRRVERADTTRAGGRAEEVR